MRHMTLAEWKKEEREKRLLYERGEERLKWYREQEAFQEKHGATFAAGYESLIGAALGFFAGYVFQFTWKPVLVALKHDQYLVAIFTLVIFGCLTAVFPIYYTCITNKGLKTETGRNVFRIFCIVGWACW